MRVCKWPPRTIFTVLLVFSTTSLLMMFKFARNQYSTVIPTITRIHWTRSISPSPTAVRFTAQNGMGIEVIVFSAYIRCHKNRTIQLNVWENQSPTKKQPEPHYLCCIKSHNGSLYTSTVDMRVKFNDWVPLVASKLNCKEPAIYGQYKVSVIRWPPNINGTGNFSSNGTTLHVIPAPHCPTSALDYITPGVPLVPNTYTDLEEAEAKKIDQNCQTETQRNPSLHKNESFSFAICAKLAFGNLSPYIVIEWIEYNKKMGVSMIVVYVHELNNLTMSVFRHYQRLGMLIILSFFLPFRDEKGYERKLGEKTKQSWHDEQVVLYDCHERLRLYKYIAVVDFDEFIVPWRDQNFKQLTTRLHASHPMASVFRFNIRYHIKEWAPKFSFNGFDLSIEKFKLHTKPAFDNEKLLIIPGRIHFATTSTHNVQKLLKPYTL